MPEINRILCPIDFSDTAQHAIDHAIAFAKWYKASIVALHVYNPVFYPVPGLMPTTDPEFATDSAEIHRLQDQVANAFHPALAAGIDVDALVETGPPADEILDCASRERVNLIVLGTHGLGGFERLLLGSVTEKVLRKASCAVLTVPPRAHATSQLPFRRLLCPVDFSDPSLAALEYAFSLAKEANAGLTILHVLDWPQEGEPRAYRSFNVPEYQRMREEAVRERFATLVPADAREWCTPATRIAHGKPYREILGVAAEDEMDLIVMGVHGRNPIDMMLLGSTTNHVVRQATCPVLTVRR